jgi:hypothetical protein
MNEYATRRAGVEHSFVGMARDAEEIGDCPSKSPHGWNQQPKVNHESDAKDHCNARKNEG